MADPEALCQVLPRARTPKVSVASCPAARKWILPRARDAHHRFGRLTGHVDVQGELDRLLDLPRGATGDDADRPDHRVAAAGVAETRDELVDGPAVATPR